MGEAGDSAQRGDDVVGSNGWCNLPNHHFEYRTPGFRRHADARSQDRAPSVDGTSPVLGQPLDRQLGESEQPIHQPLQVGNRQIGKVQAPERCLEPLREVANLTADVIVGFPGEDDAAFAGTLRAVDDAGITKVHVFPYSPRPGTATAADDPIPPAAKKERGARLRALSHELQLRRWRAKVGDEDVVLMDRPGRGYGDDYSPFLVDAPVGALVRVRARDVTEEGIVAVAA